LGGAQGFGPPQVQQNPYQITWVRTEWAALVAPRLGVRLGGDPVALVVDANAALRRRPRANTNNGISGEWEGTCGTDPAYRWPARNATFQVKGNFQVMSFGGSDAYPPYLLLLPAQPGATAEVSVEADGRKSTLFVDVAP